MKSILFVLLLSFCFLNNLFGQAYSEQGLEASDSLKNLEYPYILPIYGAQAFKLGYKLPYSAGDTNFPIQQELELTIYGKTLI